MADRDIIISVKTVLVFLGIVAALWLTWLVLDIILMLFVALVLSLTLEPFVEWLTKKGVPRPASVIGTVLAVLALFVAVGSVAIVPFQQLSKLAGNLPNYIENLSNLPVVDAYQLQINDAIFNQLSQTTGNIVSATWGAFSGLLSVLVVIVFTVYMLLDFDNLRNKFIKLFAKKYQNDVKIVMNRIEVKLGGWLRGQVLLMVIIGFATYLGLLLLGVDYALALALIAGILEIVPIIGPVLSAVPALIVAFAISPLTGLGVLGLYILIQQLENHLVVPKVMQKAVGFNPLVTIVALMVGGNLLGLIGAILAVPITIVFFEVVKYFLYESH